MPTPYLHAAAIYLALLALPIFADETHQQDGSATEKPTLHESLRDLGWLIGEWELRGNNQFNGGVGYYVGKVAVRTSDDMKTLHVSYTAGFTTGVMFFGRKVTNEIVPTNDPHKLHGQIQADGVHGCSGQTWKGRSVFSLKQKSSSQIVGEVFRELTLPEKEFLFFEPRPKANCGFEITAQEVDDGMLETTIVFRKCFSEPVVKWKNGSGSRDLVLKFRRRAKKSP